MIASLGAPMLVALTLGAVGVGHILLSTYKSSTAIGAVVIGGVLAVGVTHGLGLASVALLGMGEPTSSVVEISPVVGVLVGWVGGLWFA